jgi:hypothetical protein
VVRYHLPVPLLLRHLRLIHLVHLVGWTCHAQKVTPTRVSTTSGGTCCEGLRGEVWRRSGYIQRGFAGSTTNDLRFNAASTRRAGRAQIYPLGLWQLSCYGAQTQEREEVKSTSLPYLGRKSMSPHPGGWHGIKANARKTNTYRTEDPVSGSRSSYRRA